MQFWLFILSQLIIKLDPTYLLKMESKQLKNVEMMHKCFLSVLCLFVLCNGAVAQPPKDLDYPPVNEDLFVQTVWKYTYTTHAETNTILHKADKYYEHFLYFKYDYTVESFLDGEFTSDNWKLNTKGNAVYAPFRSANWWRIVEFSADILILEYKQSTEFSYRYHFVRHSLEQSPFKRPTDLLPSVNVDNVVQNNTKYKYRFRKGEKGKRGRFSAKREARRKALEQRRIDRTKEPLQAPVFMQIELVGGGFYGGIDPVYRNNLVIKTDGRIIKEFQTEHMGLRVIKRAISRETLEQLVAYIEQRKFFELDQVYTCESRACMQRLSGKPRPIALRLAVTHGTRRKMITVSIWEGLGQTNRFIDYPKELEDIIKAIENVALY